MTKQIIKASIKGRQRSIPCIRISSTANVVLNGTLIKVGSVHDEFWMESRALPAPDEIIQKLRKSSFRPDVFKFAQNLPEIVPKYDFYMEWDNVAAIPIESYDFWLRRQANRKARQAIARSQRRGIVVELVDFDDNFVKGISAIYNETPIRQGRKFWHYGKDFETVKKENSTFLERSDFIAAFYDKEMAGFIKIVYQDEIANIMQILPAMKHRNKSTMNALLAEAIQLCEKKGKSHLIYGKYVYGKKTKSSLADFKRHNGFERYDIPVFYVPLSLKGRIAMKLGFHKGVRNIIPASAWNNVLSLRSKYFARHT